MSLLSLLIILAIAIIIGLGSYAWHLVKKVKEQDKRQNLATAKAELQIRNKQQSLLKDIRFLARSTIQEQCEITEAVLRIHYAISLLDPNVWEFNELQSMRSHYQLTRDMPILDNYKKLSPREQSKLDKTRWELEDKNKNEIMKELHWLVEYNFPKVTKLQ